ncbi:MAG: hypothetical protein FWE84_02630, partial [Firmicutes bacterium]|nr:hypothetical protein [Bacillota bacterium]
ADDFTGALGNALFLSEFKAADVRAVMDAIADGIAENMLKAEAISYAAPILDGRGEDGEGGDSGFKLPPEAEELIIKLFSASNLNKNRITDYEEEKIEEYKLSVSDKSMAAFLNDIILNTFLDNKNLKNAIAEMATDAVAEALKGMGGPISPVNAIDLKSFDYKNILQIRQISFYKAGEDAHIKFVTQTKIKNVVDALFKGITGDNFLRNDASSMAKLGFNSLRWIVNKMITGILPNELFLSVDIPLTGAGEPQILINGQDYKGLMDIFDAFGNSGNGGYEGEQGEESENPSDLFEGLFGTGSAIDNAIKSMNATIVMNGKSGSIKFDAINFFLELAEINLVDVEKDGETVKERKPEGECITSNDVYLLLRTIVADTERAMKDKPDYTKYKHELNDTQFVFENGVLKLVPINPADPPRDLVDINDEYQTALFFAFAKSYGLRTTGTGAVTSFDQLFEVISEGDTNKFLGLFDGGKIQEVVRGDAKGVTLNSLLLSALVAAQAEKFLGDAEFDFTLRFVALYTIEDDDGVTHNMLEVGIEVNPAALFGDIFGGGEEEEESGNLIMNILNEMLSALIPESILVRAEIDITIGGGAGFTYLPSRLSLDRLTYEQADRIIGLLAGFAGGEETDFGDLVGGMLDPVRDMINMMADSLPGLTIGENAIVMPDIYTLMASFLGGVLTAAEVESVLKGIYFDVNDDDNVWLRFNDAEAADTADFIKDKTDAVNLAPYIANPALLVGGAELTTFSDTELLSMIKGQLPANYGGEVTSVMFLAKSDAGDTAKGLRKWLKGFDGKEYNDADYMLITVRLEFATLGYDASFGGFMPETFYATLLYKIDGLDPTFEWFRFNDMSDGTQDDLYKLLGFAGLDNILGEGAGNIGGGFFEDIAGTVLDAVNEAIKELVKGIPVGVDVTYSYEASGEEGTVGTMVVSVKLK